MKIGIICAVDTELQPFLPHIQNCKTSKKAMLTFYEGTINDVDIVTVFCGVGKTNAAIATQILIDTYGTDIIINSGTAGGMDINLDLFDTVISTEAIHHDVHEGILTQFQPWMPSVSIKADEALLKAAKKAVTQLDIGSKAYFGRMVTGEKFIEDDGRDEILSAFGPLTVDMETASIAHVCYVNSIPYIAVRTVTDTAKHAGTDTFEKNCPPASVISKDIVLELLKNI